MTNPAGTVVLVVVVTAPSLRPAAAMALLAAAWVSPVTFGTVFAAFVTVTETEPDVAMFPELLRAVAVSACAPFAAVAVFQESVVRRSVTSIQVEPSIETDAGNTNVVRRACRNRDRAATVVPSRGAHRYTGAFMSRDIANE